MTKIKICGLSREEDIDMANAYKPDYIGFVFAESGRKVSASRAAELKKRLDGSIPAVGVFADAEPDFIAGLCRSGIIDLVQLHGGEDASYIELLRKKVPVPVIKAVRVRDRLQVLRAVPFPCEYLLLDTFREGAYGGTGKSFDHTLIPELEKPFFLAGGLRAENIRSAAAFHPFCLDVSSGAETGGRKDAEKFREIIRIVREEC